VRITEIPRRQIDLLQVLFDLFPSTALCSVSVIENDNLGLFLREEPVDVRKQL